MEKRGERIIRGLTEFAERLNGEQSGGDAGDATDADDASICSAIQSLHRQRRAAMKLRIKLTNGVIATVATTALGYHGGLPKKEREAKWKQATEIVKRLDKGDDDVNWAAIAVDTRSIAGLVAVSYPGRKGFEDYENRLLAEMIEQAKWLPVAPWFEHEDRRGIGLGMLATIIGEAGDLSNYPNPAKLWKRLFGAPYEKDGATKMPSAWRKGDLSKAEWSAIGYNPTRNSMFYNCRNNIVRQNKGPYRARYDEARAKAAERHPDWKDGHLHAHAQLCAIKRLTLDLWVAWRRM